MLTNYVLIKLNGEPFNCYPNMSLKDLLVYLNCDISSIIIEYNCAIIQDTSFDQIMISSGDVVEILTIVGGG